MSRTDDQESREVAPRPWSRGDHAADAREIARAVIAAAATADAIPTRLLERLAGVALLAGIGAADVAPLLDGSPFAVRRALGIAGQLLAASGRIENRSHHTR